MKYVTRPRAFFIDSDWGGCTADTIIESERGPEKTGLLDHNGTPIYRVPETVDFGFRVQRK